MSLTPALAGALGRPDLSRSPVRPRATSSNAAIYPQGRGATAVGLTTGVHLGPVRSDVAANLDTGTISLGMIGASVIAVAIFVYWTRGHQG